jgi:signal transduction histidine kinase/ligand-binding sensor domain-containing protein
VRGLALLVLLLGVSSPSYALDPTRRITQLQMTKWLRKSGIKALAQTADGYLWIATGLGVARFDGRRFTVYGKSGYPGLPTNDIWSLAAAGETLWIGTSGGLARLDAGTITAVPAAPTEWIMQVLVDRTGRLWIATQTGLFRQEGDHFERLVSPEGKAFAGGGFAAATDGSIWIHGLGGLWRWQEGALHLISHGRFSRLLADPDGSIWAVGRDVLVHFGVAGEERFVLPRDLHLDIVRDGAGSIWLTSTVALMRRTAIGALQTMPADVLGSTPTNMLVDSEGSLWIGTEAGGLFRLRDAEVTPWSAMEGLPSRVTYGFSQEENGGIWITTDKGVARVSGDKVDAPMGPLPVPVVSAYTEEGRVWMGTTEGLVLREAGKTRRVLDAIPMFIAKRDDGVWVATQAGLDHFRDGALVASYGMKQGAPTDLFISLLLARDRSIWAGHAAGVCRLAGETFHCFSSTEGAPHAMVEDIHEDAAGDVWLGTNEDGLYRVHEGKFTRFTTEQGLPSNTHYAVLEDDYGHLWTSSSIGIARIDKASLHDGTARVRLFDEHQGMRTADCFGGGMTGLRARDGKLWFATTDGAVVIDPSLADPPPPVLASRIEERTQDNRGWLTFRYAAPTLAFGDVVTFRHQLTGFDDDWVAASEPVATYTNVPPGSYRFLAQARIAPGVWGPAAEFLVTVPARWWQTGLFRVAVVAALALLLLGIYRLRLARLLQQKRRLETVVEARTQELAQANATLEDRVERAVTSLREAERMAAYGTMVAGVAHEVRQPIFALGTTAYVLQQRLSDRADVAPQLALVARETKRVNAIMDELLAFARPAELSKTRVAPSAVLREAADSFRAEHDPEGTLPVSIEDSTTGAAFVDEARVVQVLVNLMGNAKKHAAGVTRIRLRATESSGRLSISVENDGAGIPAEHLPHIFEPFYGAGDGKGTGLGLAIVRRLVELHGGDVRVASDGDGTRFTLELPMEPS